MDVVGEQLTPSKDKIIRSITSFLAREGSSTLPWGRGFVRVVSI